MKHNTLAGRHGCPVPTSNRLRVRWVAAVAVAVGLLPLLGAPASAQGSSNANLSSLTVSPEGIIGFSAVTITVDDVQEPGRVRVSPTRVELGEACPGRGSDPVATPVTVNRVPVVVESTVDEYFVLYARSDADAESWEIPVAVVRGEAGTTTLTENVEALPVERYRVEKYLVSDPADVDGDCVDDITELDDPVGMNPVNSAPSVGFSDGAVSMPDLDTYLEMARSIYGATASRILLLNLDSERPGLYFINASTHVVHQNFLDAVGIERSRTHNEVIFYDPELEAPDGSLGAYYLWMIGYMPFSEMERIYAFVAASMPTLRDNLYVYVPSYQLKRFQGERLQYEESRMDVVFDEDVLPDTGVDLLNHGVGFGRLRVMDPDGRPHPREIVVYEAVPNDVSRVAGIVTTARQTPLSHVNLRAIQDGIPNAYIRDVFEDPDIAALVDGFVRYEVTETGWSLRAATPAEVDEHYESSRPTQAQTPQRDLSATSITALGDVSFEEWPAFGVKAANVAELGRLRFAAGTVPDGFAIPFYFYDEFMKAHGFYDRIKQMLADADFQTDFTVQDDMLDDLRDDIKDADTPQWITDALTEMHASFPAGTSLRYRSSTNNEDLPGFSGAGLYDSKTQHPDEEPLSKSLKQVYASLWNFRAFTERELHRIDHTAAAMGVLVHPNFSDELANGVAVSFDPFYEQDEVVRYYVNTQIGEDLVTNPEAHSVPEELHLHPSGSYAVLSTSNLVPRGQLLMSDAQLVQLAQHLTTIHDRFEALYDPATGEPFAIEIEFKITAENILAIKQARPWIFSDATTTTTTGGGGGGPATPTESVEIEGAVFAAAAAPATFTAAGLDGSGPYTLRWTAAGPDGFTAADTGEFVLTPPAGGTYTITVTVTSADGETLTDTATLTVLGDIAGHPFADDIVWLAEQGITRGCATHRYCPNDNITRGQMAALLNRALELPAASVDFFYDDKDSQFQDDINRLAQAGITRGCAIRAYCPNDNITRGQMAALLNRALELPAASVDFFYDDKDSQFQDDINRLAQAGITRGCAIRAYCPNDNITRGQMAAFLHQARHLIAALWVPETRPSSLTCRDAGRC